MRTERSTLKPLCRQWSSIMAFPSRSLMSYRWPRTAAMAPWSPLQSAPLRPAASGVIPQALRWPPFALGRVHRGCEKRSLPRRLSARSLHQQFPRGAVGGHRLAAIGNVPRRIQRVAALRMRRAAHHRQREARAGLARTVVIDDNTACLRPRGVDAARRQLGTKHTILVRPVCRRGEREACPGVCGTHRTSRLPRLAGYTSSRGAETVKPAAFTAAGFTLYASPAACTTHLGDGAQIRRAGGGDGGLPTRARAAGF